MTIRDSIARATVKANAPATKANAPKGIDLIHAAKLRDLTIAHARAARDAGHAIIAAKAEAGKARVRAMCAGWRQEDAARHGH
jgi:hypothetical protein